MTNEEFQRSKSFEENLKEWNLLSLEEMGESVKEGSLYVIGNGFDMLHGVRSSYYDFSRTLGKRSTVRFYLEKYLKTDDLWAVFFVLYLVLLTYFLFFAEEMEIGRASCRERV